ncbi:MAG: hypothetical protein MZU97_10390 [Bacillus subtilis]|nr:hypothetical protein [Bacillus subtilis]
MILAKLAEAFPKLRKARRRDQSLRETASVPVDRSRTNRSRKGLSINEQIELENGEKLKIFDNLWLTGPLAPAGSRIGSAKFQNGVAYRRRRSRNTSPTARTTTSSATSPTTRS